MSNQTAWERWELGSLDNPAKPTRRKEATAVELPTVAEIERIREQARREGYDAGYAKGSAAVRAEAEKLAAACARTDEAFSNIEADVATELLALAVEIARQVVRGELAARPEALLDVVREALAQLPHQHVVLYLHPDDASLVRSHLGDTLAHAGHRINDDAHLARGDCVMEAGGSLLDGTVATRWRRVIEALGLNEAWQAPEAEKE